MDAEDITVMIEDLENPDGPLIQKTIKGEYNLKKIKAYIFTEDWYLDPETLRIVKKVRAIAPVGYFTNDEDDKISKRIIFEVEL